MSIRLFRHQIGQDDVPAGGDEVLLWSPIPADGSFNNFSGEIHLTRQALIDVLVTTMYSLKGVVTRDFDPDLAKNANTVWDIMVPKSEDISSVAATPTLDMDTVTTAETGPAYEPGEPNTAEILGIADDLGMDEWYKKHKLLSYQGQRGGYDPTTPPGDWLPGDVVQVKSGKKIHVDSPSWAMLGVSNPSMDDTTASIQTFGGVAEWMQLKYIDTVLEQAFVQLIGATEAGAESPFDLAAQMIGDFLEPTVYEDVGSTFDAGTFRVWGIGTWDISVPGMDRIGVLTAQ